jgi:hypothetical protein
VPMWILLGLATGAHAQSLTMEAITRVEIGRQEPSVSFHSAVEGRLTTNLVCGGRSFTLDKAVRINSTTTLPLPGLPAGDTYCAGVVRLDEPNGAFAEVPLELRIARLGTLTFEIRGDDVDLKAHTLVIHPSRPLKSAEAELIGIGGVVLERTDAVLVDPLGPTFRWTTDEEVLKLVVIATDQSDIRAQLVLQPWFYAIPHEDLVFASGSAEITSSEAPKLEKCWADVRRVLDKYGSVVDMKMYVAGYTDTVGPTASNQGLSERRAKAIASWYLRRGFPGEVWYQGFGEEVLALSTPDETDALANRRAIYLLGAEMPAVSTDLPRQDWKRP